MCVESDGCEIEGCSSSDEVRTLSGSMSPRLRSNPDLHPCTPGEKFRAALLKCRSPIVAAVFLSFGNVLNYMDRYTVTGKNLTSHFTLKPNCVKHFFCVSWAGNLREDRGSVLRSLIAGVILR